METEREVMPHAVYRHYKGNYYCVITIAHHTNEWETEPVVCYYGLYGDGDTWVRPLDEFLSEAPQEIEVNPTGQVYRFEIMHREDVTERN